MTDITPTQRLLLRRASELERLSCRGMTREQVDDAYALSKMGLLTQQLVEGFLCVGYYINDAGRAEAER